MKSLSKKLMVYCCILLLIVCGSLGFFSYFNSANSVRNEVNKSLEQMAVQGALIVQEAAEGQLSALEAFANNEKIKDPATSLQEKITLLIDESKRAGHIRMGIADLNGSLTSSNGAVSDIRDRQYFIDASNGKPSVSDPIISKVDGSVLVPLAVPIKNNDRVTNVLVAFRDGNNLSDITDQIVFGETGAAYMITKDGTTVAHRNRELVLNMDNDFENVKKDPELAGLVELNKKMVDGQRGVGYYKYQGESKYMGFAPVEGTPWSLAVTASEAEIMSGINNLRNIIVLISVLLVILGIAAVYLLTRTIIKPINKLVGVANRIAGGDLDVIIDVDTKDEVGILARAFRSMAEKINDVMSSINSASEQVASGARQVSDSSMALSQGATEQASSIEQLTASLEEISSQTKLNAQNANQANELAETAKLNAMQGGTQMKEMLKAMEDINDASANISKIIKVIDEIAFQTNILALNAAVEAARAGQHGKGFAVVAEEVRNLAARSANAAKETTDMIEGSVKKVEAGMSIADETDTALNKIVEEITKVADLVNNIAVASNEQAAGIEQINQGIMQVSQVVQTNSATSEEGAAASEELSSQAELLKEMVGKFKLRQDKKEYNKSDEFSPEVLKIIENMSGKKNDISKPEEEELGEIEAAKPRIALSDKEFGKY
ncbi:MAG: methyl-accepting chemotaxis protein [Acetivibrionales bacterium]|jgi:methyl-accepting chemotaxis protein